MTIIRDEEKMLFRTPRLNLLIITFTLIGLFSFIIFAILCNSKEDYDRVHAFLTPLPVSFRWLLVGNKIVTISIFSFRLSHSF
jgi:hypothetical protein